MGGVAAGASSTALLPRSPAAPFLEAEVAEHGGASRVPTQGKRECCTMLCHPADALRESAAGLT